MYSRRQKVFIPHDIQAIYKKAASGGFSHIIGVMLLQMAKQEPIDEAFILRSKSNIEQANLRMMVESIACWLRPFCNKSFMQRLRSEVMPSQSAFRWLFSHNPQSPFDRALVHMALNHMHAMSETDKIRFRIVLARFENACRHLGFRPVVPRIIASKMPPFMVAMPQG
jgi:hypothetical protein